ncbi:MAG: hypothetical protein JW716_01170 [Candidatus Aenigmarchaeota archaeon]|nr:hypothetical protein [Candidatus Aenigmarchaeota archaeon]
MVNEEVVAYIKEQLKNGFPLEEIRNYLIDGGYYMPDVVDAAIMVINGEQQAKIQPPSPQENPQKKRAEGQPKPEKGRKNMRNIIMYILVIGLGIVVGLKALAYFEIIDIYAMIGFDPFSFLGGTISGNFFLK